MYLGVPVKRCLWYPKGKTALRCTGTKVCPARRAIVQHSVLDGSMDQQPVTNSKRPNAGSERDFNGKGRVDYRGSPMVLHTSSFVLILLMTSSVNSMVPSPPPRSEVRTPLMTDSKVAS